MASNKNKDPIPSAPLTNEERTRHDALFFCQGPIEGLLPGEKARELFLRSKLSLQMLSQIWHLVDVPHDNMLDSSEFAIAMHLIQTCLRGAKLPEALPEELTPKPVPEVRIPPITQREYSTYRRVYDAIQEDRLGLLKANIARRIFVTSELSPEQLSMVWDLSDIDRDGKLTCEEFAIACHIIRYLKKGNTLEGCLNALALLPHKLPKTDIEAKKSRIKDLENRKTKLMALKERRRSQLSKEEERVKLWEEKLKYLRLQHQYLADHSICEDPGKGHIMGVIERDTNHLQDILDKMKAVTIRLKKEHERVRQETAKVIMQEQQLSQELKTLQQEAEQLRKKRQRNSLIKDLDPFHQLYEDRKEEKLTGQKQTTKKEVEIHIPQSIDPFNSDTANNVYLSGDEIFIHSNNNMLPVAIEDTHLAAWNSSGNTNFMELTYGFEDSFMEHWGPVKKPGFPCSPGLADKEPELVAEEMGDEEDSIFFEVSGNTVKMESQEISMTEDVDPEHRDQLEYLETKLDSIEYNINKFNKDQPQLVFRDPANYTVPQEQSHKSDDSTSRWDEFLSSRRASSGSSSVFEKNPEKRRKSYHGEHWYRGRSTSRRSSSADIESDTTSEEGSYSSRSRQPQKSSSSSAVFADFEDDDKSSGSSQASYFRSLSPTSPSARKPLSSHLNQTNSAKTAHDVIDKDTYSDKTNKPLDNIDKDSVDAVKSSDTKGVGNIYQTKDSSDIDTEDTTDNSVQKHGNLVDNVEINTSSKDSSDQVLGQAAQDSVHVYKNVNTDSVQSVNEYNSVPTENTNAIEKNNIETKDKDSTVNEPQVCVSHSTNKEQISAKTSNTSSSGAEISSKEDTPLAKPDVSDILNSSVTNEISGVILRSKNEKSKARLDNGQNKSDESVKEKYLRKAKSWCVSEPSPVAPPRRKSRKSQFFNVIGSKEPGALTKQIPEEIKPESPTINARKTDNTQFGVVKDISQESQQPSNLKQKSPNIKNKSFLHSNAGTPQPWKPRTPPATPVADKTRPGLKKGKSVDSLSSDLTDSFDSPASRPRSELLSYSSVSSGCSTPKSPKSPAKPPRKPSSKKRQAPTPPVSPYLSPEPIRAYNSVSSLTSSVSQSSETPPVPPPRKRRESKKHKHSSIEEATSEQSASSQTKVTSVESDKVSNIDVDIPVRDENYKTKDEQFYQNIDSPKFDNSSEQQLQPGANREAVTNVPTQSTIGGFGKLPVIDSPEIPSDDIKISPSFSDESTSPSTVTDCTSPPTVDPVTESSEVPPSYEESLSLSSGFSEEIFDKFVEHKFEEFVDCELTPEEMEQRKQDLDKLREQFFGKNRGNAPTQGSTLIDLSNSNISNSPSAPQTQSTFLTIGAEPEVSKVSNSINITTSSSPTTSQKEDHKSKVVIDLEKELFIPEFKGNKSYDKSNVSKITVGSPKDKPNGSNDPFSTNSRNDPFEITTVNVTTNHDSFSMHNDPFAPSPNDPFTTKDTGSFNNNDPGETVTKITVNDNASLNKTTNSSNDKDSFVAQVDNLFDSVISDPFGDDPFKPKKTSMELDLSHDSDISEHTTNLSGTFDPHGGVTNSTDSGVTLLSFQSSDAQSADFSDPFGESSTDPVPPPSAFSNSLYVNNTNTDMSNPWEAPSSPASNRSNDSAPPLPDTQPPANAKTDPFSSLIDFNTSNSDVDSNKNAINSKQSPSRFDKDTTCSLSSGDIRGSQEYKQNTTTTNSTSFTTDIVSPSSDMDPLWSSRHVGKENDPVSKAFDFMERTEPKIRIKRVESHDDEVAKVRQAEIEREREEIMAENKIKKKTIQSWVPTAASTPEPSESQRKYEERKKRMSVTSPPPPKTVPEKKDTKPANPGAIDSRSITDNKAQTKEHWESTLSSQNAKLFPTPSAGVPTHRSPATSPVTFVRSVEDESIDIHQAKQHWEQRFQENSDNLKPKQKPESAIEREIRLQQERERELQKEKELRQSQQKALESVRGELAHNTRMPIYKVPAPGGDRVSSTVTYQAYEQMTEADRDSVAKPESVIDRDIREQMERETEMKKVAEINKHHHDEQQNHLSIYDTTSGYKKQRESVIDREIREQMERENEMRKQRSSMYIDETDNDVPVTNIDEVVYEPPPELPKTPPPVQQYTSATVMNYSEPPRRAKKEEAPPQRQPGPQPKVEAYNGYETRSNASNASDTNYQDAISRNSHQGESMIARELREQQEREDELRKSWKDRGFDVPLSNEKVDTPFNRPDPTPSMPRSTSAPGGQMSKGFPQAYLDSSKPLVKSTTMSQVSSQPPPEPKPEQKPRRSVVQPLIDFEQDETTYFFASQNETPVEREIRVAREREAALRAERGLPAKEPETENKGIVIEMQPSAQRNYEPNKTQPTGTMRRLSTNRLQKEFEKEKLREFELKKFGTITTMSSERMVDGDRYDFTGPTRIETPQPKSANTPKQTTPLKQPPQEPKPTPPPAKAPITPKVTYTVKTESTPVVNGGGPIKATNPVHHSTPHPVKSQPPRRAPPPEMPQGIHMVKRSTSGSDNVIERELAEVKAREDELRQQRALITGKTPKQSENVDQSSYSYTVSTNRPPTPDSTNKSKRKSALAEEWEKKWSATSPPS